MTHRDLIPAVLLTTGTLISLVTIATFLAGAGR
jgi:hypothetical protein